MPALSGNMLLKIYIYWNEMSESYMGLYNHREVIKVSIF